jgi:phosphatidylethanolamine N-methyltransferase
MRDCSLFTSALCLHLDHHVAPRSAPAHPAAEGRTSLSFLSFRRRRRPSRSRPDHLGTNSVGPGCARTRASSAFALTRVSLSVFRVPTTHDVLTALFHPSYPKSHIDIINLGLLAFQLILFYTLPRTPRRVFFFLYFAFWRAAYDAGLGYVLTKQSKRRWIVRTVQRLGWLDEDSRPEVRAWIRRQLVGKMGKDYSFDVRSCFHVRPILRIHSSCRHRNFR